jgi:hypothetical protein
MHFQPLICATPASGVRGLRESARKVRLVVAENDRAACLLASVESEDSYAACYHRREQG